MDTGGCSDGYELVSSPGGCSLAAAALGLTDVFPALRDRADHTNGEPVARHPGPYLSALGTTFTRARTGDTSIRNNRSHKRP